MNWNKQRTSITKNYKSAGIDEIFSYKLVNDSRILYSTTFLMTYARRKIYENENANWNFVTVPDYRGVISVKV